MWCLCKDVQGGGCQQGWKQKEGVMIAHRCLFYLKTQKGCLVIKCCDIHCLKVLIYINDTIELSK